jgi:uncharacterized iron-regulated membrane protein
MSNPRIWNRRLHRWGAALVALPFLVVLVTGLLLQVKKQVPWVQPREHKRKHESSALTLPEIVERVQRIPEANVRTWSDIDRIDVRPGKGLIKVVATNRWEAQLDMHSGDVLQVAYRRSELIESLHDGSWFHDRAKLWVFLPSAVIVLALWGTGVYLWVLPYSARRARQQRSAMERVPQGQMP